MRTSLPADFSAEAHTNGKFARVGFSDPQRPTSRYFAGEPPPDVPSCAATTDAPAMAARPAQACAVDLSIDLRVPVMETSSSSMVTAARSVLGAAYQPDRLADDRLDRQNEPMPLPTVRTVHHL